MACVFPAVKAAAAWLRTQLAEESSLEVSTLKYFYIFVFQIVKTSPFFAREWHRSISDPVRPPHVFSCFLIPHMCFHAEVSLGLERLRTPRRSSSIWLMWPPLTRPRKIRSVLLLICTTFTFYPQCSFKKSEFTLMSWHFNCRSVSKLSDFYLFFNVKQDSRKELEENGGLKARLVVHHVRPRRRNPQKTNPHPVFKVVVFSFSHQQNSSILSHVSAPFPFTPSSSLSSLGFLSLFSSFALKLCCWRRFVFREQRTRLWGAGRMFAIQQQPFVFLLKKKNSARQ